MSQPNPIRAILACDESGAKGYASRHEKLPGEVGVMAGILIHEEIAGDTHAVFQSIYDAFRPAQADKLHIADLPPEQQEALRRQIYRAILLLDLPCFWYAVHVEGLHNYHAEFQQLQEKHKPPPNPRFKLGSPRENPPLLHEELFQGFFCNVLAFLESRQVSTVALQIRTDRVDTSTARRFQKSASRFLDDGPTESVATALDTETNRVVSGSIKMEIDWPDSLQLKVSVEDLTVECAEDGVTLAADVLANSLNHLFMSRDESELYAPLNDNAAIKHHPLAKQFTLFGNPGVGDIVGDRLRAHPKAPKPP